MLKPFKPREYYARELELDPDRPFAFLTRHTALCARANTPEAARDALHAVLRVPMLKEEYHAHYGFPLVTAECLDLLHKLLRDKHVLDAGSGTGFLAQALAERDICVVAADNEAHGYGFRSVYRRDSSQDAADLLPGNFTAVLMSWPCAMSDFAFRVANAMSAGALLVHQGEGPGGATAASDFFALTRDWPRDDEASTALNEAHAQFAGIKDRWTVLMKPTGIPDPVAL